MSSINLTKGGNLNLTKIAGLKAVTVGLGWKPRETDGAAFDLDASLFMVEVSNKVATEKGFIFYGNLKSPDGSVEHSGDNLSGSAGGDAEQIKVDLASVPANIDRLVIAVTIYKAKDRKQNFGQVTNSYIRVVNQADNVEAGRFDLGEDYATETSMIFGELYRNAGDWKFKAVGSGYAGGLADVCRQYGVAAEAEA